VIIGQGTLPVLCGNVFARHGNIVGVCSPDEPLQVWSQAAKVPHFRTLSNFQAFGESQQFDYLFSIVNYKVLRDDILRLPSVMSVNYHDGPLPRYGGVYATTWALMNRETSHGIAWHVMTEQVDGGDLLKQVVVPIDPDDTAYKLNLKCYYSAVSAFTELVPELMAGTARRVPQDLTRRTYFGLSTRPANDCLISFDWPAEQIEAFCRALDFEGTPNPIGLPKVIIDGRLYVARRIRLTNTPSLQKPGTVISVDPAVRVATATNDIFLETILTLSGRPVPIHELTGYGLALGASIYAGDLSAVTQPEQP